MKRNELRTGNLVNIAIAFEKTDVKKISELKPIIFSDYPFCVDAIDYDDISVHDFPDFKGTQNVNINHIAEIPLTEEWLIKFGFEQPIKNNFTFGDFRVWISPIPSEGIFVFFEQSIRLSHIKYVHQLQNLFYCLVGEELTLK